MTREEAIKVYNGLLNQKIKEAFEFFVPELRESEDERIRKDLVNFLQSPFIKGKLTDERVAPWLAYLEKQKEHKEIPMPDSTKLIEMWDKEKAKLEEKDFRGDTWRIAYNAFMDGFTTGTCVRFDCKKEQKPSEVCYGTKGDPDPAGVWKPSEEQMKALKETIDFAPETFKPICTLATLYDQLKKL